MRRVPALGAWRSVPDTKIGVRHLDEWGSVWIRMYRAKQAAAAT
jgi:hypothetical protein